MDYSSILMLAWIKLKQNKTAEAKYLFNLALLLSPGDASALNGLKQIK